MSNAEQRQRVVTDFEQSGLSRQQYCAQHQISVNTLDNWRRKVKAAKFVRVRVDVTPTRPVRHSRFAVVLSNGRRIETETGFDEHELVRLIRTVESVAGQ